MKSNVSPTPLTQGNEKGEDMQKSKTFTVADLSLRDCWKICKDVSLVLIGMGIFYGFGYLLVWGTKQEVRAYSGQN